MLTAYRACELSDIVLGSTVVVLEGRLLDGCVESGLLLGACAGLSLLAAGGTAAFQAVVLRLFILVQVGTDHRLRHQRGTQRHPFE